MDIEEFSRRVIAAADPSIETLKDGSVNDLGGGWYGWWDSDELEWIISDGRPSDRNPGVVRSVRWFSTPNSEHTEFSVIEQIMASARGMLLKKPEEDLNQIRSVIAALQRAIDGETDRPQTPALPFTIDRGSWLRGEGHDFSKLLRGNRAESGLRSMCCLGFACLAGGADREEIMDVASPHDLRSVHQIFPVMSNVAIATAMEVNDALRLDDALRERMLVNVLGCMGMFPTFID